MAEEFLPLERLLTQGRGDDFPIAFDFRNSIICWAEWRQSVAAWTETFSKRLEQKWAVYVEDSVEFSVLFFALLHSEKTIYLAANSQLITQRQLDKFVDAFAGTFDSNVVSKPVLGSQNEGRKGDRLALYDGWAELETERTSIFLFTSGSTGEPMLISKTLGQLSREIRTLDQTFGKECQKTLVLSTVSHQHIYGLLFRVLWPLARGVMFQAKTCHYGEEILNAADLQENIVLVSSPSHLSRLPEQLPWEELQFKLLEVYSSAAPLGLEGAQRFYEQLAIYPTEVFGSSETGGIAWRQQHHANVPWRVFPGIRIRSSEGIQQIELQSPHMPSMEWHFGEDLIELIGENEFRLLGRVDSIVKIEGKRVSLTGLEARLKKHKLVHDSRVIALDGKREQTAAIVVLTEEGTANLLSQGKLHINNQLGDHLASEFERVTLPKRWRYVSRFPYNQQGKTTLAILRELFGVPDLKNRLPNVLLFEGAEELSWILRMEVPSGLDFFDGHFPEEPILPGMAMVYWVEYYARLLFKLRGDVCSLQRLKFHQIVRPKQRLLCTLILKPEELAVTFSFTSQQGAHASGKMKFLLVV